MAQTGLFRMLSGPGCYTQAGVQTYLAECGNDRLALEVKSLGQAKKGVAQSMAQATTRQTHITSDIRKPEILKSLQGLGFRVIQSSCRACLRLSKTAQSLGGKCSKRAPSSHTETVLGSPHLCSRYCRLYRVLQGFAKLFKKFCSRGVHGVCRGFLFKGPSTCC